MRNTNTKKKNGSLIIIAGGLIVILILLLAAVNIAFPFTNLLGSITSYAEQDMKLREVKGLNAPEGAGVLSENDVSVDLSGKDKGYFFVNYTGAAERVRIEITPMGKSTSKDRQVYDINEGRGWQAYMFPQAAGEYTITVWKQIGDENSISYDKLFQTTTTAQWTGESEPYVYRNAYTYYDEEDPLVRTAQAVTNFDSGQESAVPDQARQIVKWVSKNIKYDYDCAAENDAGVHKGRIPSPQETYLSKKGVCSDKAALAAAMLKSIGISTRMIYGYIYNYKEQETRYHAWIEVFCDGGWKQYDPTSSYTNVIENGIVDNVTKYLTKNLVI